MVLSAEEMIVGGSDTAPPLRMRLVGARADAAPTGHDPLPARTALLLGDDPAGWRVDVPSYRRVGYRGVWEGVDVVYHGKGARLEDDFVVTAGTRPDVIELSFEGADGGRLGSGGELVIALPGRETGWSRRSCTKTRAAAVRRLPAGSTSAAAIASASAWARTTPPVRS